MQHTVNVRLRAPAHLRALYVFCTSLVRSPPCSYVPPEALTRTLLVTFAEGGCNCLRKCRHDVCMYRNSHDTHNPGSILKPKILTSVLFLVLYKHLQANGRVLECPLQATSPWPVVSDSVWSRQEHRTAAGNLTMATRQDMLVHGHGLDSCSGRSFSEIV